MKAYFVTGTDTGVGKTTVSMALLAAARRRGLRTACMKPAESGCRRSDDGDLIPADALALARISGAQAGLERVCPYRFEASVAPGVAAEEANIYIDLDRIVALYELLVAGGPELVLVEGAGGLLVPLGHGRTIADLAGALGLPLLIVGRPGLGTINHTLLTVEAARGRGLAVAGVVFSARDSQPEARTRSNGFEVERGGEVRYLGCLSYLEPAEVASIDALAAAAEAYIDCDYLLA